MTTEIRDPQLTAYLDGRRKRLAIPANQIIAEAQAEASKIIAEAYAQRDRVLDDLNTKFDARYRELNNLRANISKARRELAGYNDKLTEHARREGHARLLIVTAEACRYDRTDRKVAS